MQWLLKSKDKEDRKVLQVCRGHKDLGVSKDTKVSVEPVSVDHKV